MQQNHSASIDSIAGLAGNILESYAAAERGPRCIYGHDSGPMVLAYLAESAGAIPKDLARRIARRWVEELPRSGPIPGSFGGMGGFLAGVRAGMAIDDDFASLYERLLDQTSSWLANVEWRSSSVAWVDYDLFVAPPAWCLQARRTRGLQSSLQQHNISRISVRMRAWKVCAPGPRSICPAPSTGAASTPEWDTALPAWRQPCGMPLKHLKTAIAFRPPLRRACDWLAEQAFLADGDFITWPAVGRDGAKATGPADRRQAWCYGTPGVAWTLWDAGRVLSDDSLQLLGAEAMRSFCRVFDTDFSFPIDDIAEELAVCHGVAGTLAVADAFARYASLQEAALLRDELEQVTCWIASIGSPRSRKQT